MLSASSSMPGLSIGTVSSYTFSLLSVALNARCSTRCATPCSSSSSAMLPTSTASASDARSFGLNVRMTVPARHRSRGPSARTSSHRSSSGYGARCFHPLDFTAPPALGLGRAGTRGVGGATIASGGNEPARRSSDGANRIVGGRRTIAIDRSIVRTRSTGRARVDAHLSTASSATTATTSTSAGKSAAYLRRRLRSPPARGGPPPPSREARSDAAPGRRAGPVEKIPLRREETSGDATRSKRVIARAALHTFARAAGIERHTAEATAAVAGDERADVPRRVGDGVERLATTATTSTAARGAASRARPTRRRVRVVRGRRRRRRRPRARTDATPRPSRR
eukprot:31093-Pelagococcus_subviridis.AAC.1